MTLRDAPAMALLVPEMPTEDGFSVYKQGLPSLRLPASGTGVLYEVGSDVWDDVVVAEDFGDDAAAWFCEALTERDLRLVRFSGFRSSPQPEKFGAGAALLSDGFSMLVVSEASLAQLAERSGLGHMAERMRPNLVVDGCEAYVEDLWTALLWASDTASARLALPKPCARCSAPRVDPVSGTVGRADPVAAMKKYRSGRRMAEVATPHRQHYRDHAGDIFFGQNTNVYMDGDVVLRVGDILMALVAPAAAGLDEQIAANDIVVFSSSSCPFCSQAIKALRDAGYDPTVVECDAGTRSALTQRCGSSSVPKVFVAGKFIGGCHDGGMGGTLPLLASGTIEELLRGN